MSLAIAAQGLDVGYSSLRGPVKVIAGLDLEVETGTFLSILGPSGCGKSTFLRVVADLLRPIGGSISVMGGEPRLARSRRDVGFVFQDATLLPWRTVRANVGLPLDLGQGRLSRRIDDRRDELLALVGLEGLGDRYPHQLSGGQRQRVAIARALLGEPSLLLMDEPFGALDEITRDRLNDELLNLWRRTGITVVFVTHSIAEAVYLGQRVIVLAANPGRVIADRDLRPIKDEDARCRREDAAVVAAMAEMRQALGRAA
ncbi:MAG: ABC transporter ATP-binding protein [Alphaproteobacteria bacterium]|jgi:NitT/TauT family transport system ATP-binding protein|nr:ABC transporter ATP-binding protein [Alphaproteobacteria bacterium]